MFLKFTFVKMPATWNNYSILFISTYSVRVCRLSAPIRTNRLVWVLWDSTTSFSIPNLSTYSFVSRVNDYVASCFVSCSITEFVFTKNRLMSTCTKIRADCTFHFGPYFAAVFINKKLLNQHRVNAEIQPVRNIYCIQHFMFGRHKIRY